MDLTTVDCLRGRATRTVMSLVCRLFELYWYPCLLECHSPFNTRLLSCLGEMSTCLVLDINHVTDPASLPDCVAGGSCLERREHTTLFTEQNNPTDSSRRLRDIPFPQYF
ncbi:hypothetical protein J6590_080882 [Homalodisca vitripennis]|nr:hypothetical protein J6590_080882 [Homalodisca vitripennis]